MEDLTEPIEPLDTELGEKLEEQGITFSDWQPKTQAAPEAGGRFIIAGAPGAGKRELANQLLDKYPGEFVHQRESFIYYGNFAVGTMADYRVELKIATDRIFTDWRDTDLMWSKSMLYTHTLLDSLAYATLALQRHTEYGGVTQYTLDKSAATMAVIGAMFRDSFRFNHIFLIERAAFIDASFEGHDVQERLKLILDEFRLPYTILTEERKEQWADDVEETIKAYDIGSRNITVKPAQSSDRRSDL
jgi:hypothetical protein